MSVTSNMWPINENNEIVCSSGSGSQTVIGFVPQDQLPIGADGKLRFSGLQHSVQSYQVPPQYCGYPTYVQRGYQNTLLVNGVEQDQSLLGQSWHDLLHNKNGLINPLSQKPNILSINMGQKLVQIPGASTAPYWTDPGAITLSTNAGTVPNDIPGFVEFTTHKGFNVCKLKNPVGYGDGAAGKRRTQINFNAITSRVRVAWHLSFMMPDEDDMPYDPNTGYKYPCLIWQLKGAASPIMALTVESKGDGVNYVMYFSMKYSSDTADNSTYKRHWNEFGSGNVNAQSSSTRYFQRDFKKNEWQDVIIDCFLDERKMDTISDGGKGFINVFVNNDHVLAYGGPTLSYRDAGGVAPPPHGWNVALYRHESGVPAGSKEYDLNNQTNPAPYHREIVFRAARLLQLPQFY